MYAFFPVLSGGWRPFLGAALTVVLFSALFIAPAQSFAAEKQKRAPKKTAVSAATAVSVYDNQPLITDKELPAFLEIFPQFRAWANENMEDAHPVVARNGKADFLYSPQAAAWVKAKGWNPVRFFCVMGRMAAALVIIEEGNDMRGNSPPDMPVVADKDLELARRHLGSILKVLHSSGDTGAPPIGR